MQNLISYRSFNCKSFDELTEFLYKKPGAEERIIRSLKVRKQREILDCIDEYIVVGKEQLMVGNRKRAYRIYLIVHVLIDKYIN